MIYNFSSGQKSLMRRKVRRAATSTIEPVRYRQEQTVIKQIAKQYDAPIEVIREAMWENRRFLGKNDNGRQIRAVRTRTDESQAGQ